MHLNSNTSKADLASGINQAMAARVAILAKSVGVEKDVCMTGGVAKNAGVLEAMEKQLGVPMRRLRVDPQLMGALGAAVFARDMMGKNK
jgi:activator of 2-hydroxyglutaryl-CoA dehydratase